MHKHCCKWMDFHINEKEKIIKYDNKFREYSIQASDNVQQGITFCPWCGAKLPENLRDVFFETLETIGIEANIFELDKIPPEFKTDEWWKKRNL